ncbi:TetR/AcrR family transcriptional regulator C-terminal domain-containing protein [Pseudonocardia sp. TRM90224]|uniref:TetR/AcrR family transcriptional regulator C-terminal domain-containing protein n=1 Tax=Pseudonocardia sp. TRM90224 TaxID=2812678 RepID=UPI001E5640D1|nr:TetR/AcrR family transcriptional regulator C-terminal domain-containing protein [Pseudonocardia sp. TRM90224]
MTGSRGGRPAVLTRDGIVDAAVAVIAADGLDALTMRRLATDLGVTAMSLYRHLPGRDAVLGGVVDRLAGTVEVVVEPGEPWTTALARFAHAYRRMLLVHPRAVPLLATHPVDVDRGLAQLEGLLATFAEDSFAPEDAIVVVQSAVVFTLGHALAQVGGPPAEPAAASFYDRWYTAGLDAMLRGFTR